MSPLPFANGQAIDNNDPASAQRHGSDSEKAGQTQPQACRRCNEKKTRCDKKWPTCSICEKRNFECVYAGAPRRRGPGKSKQHVQQLEQRLKKMEQMMQQQQQQQNLHPSQTADSTSSTGRSHSSPANSTHTAGNNVHVGAPASDFEADLTPRSNGSHSTPVRTFDARQLNSLLDPSLDSSSSSNALPSKPAMDKWRERVRSSMESPNFIARSMQRVYSSNEIAWFVTPLLDEINAQFPIFDVDKLVRRIEATAPSAERSPAWTTVIESIMARVALVRAASDGIRRCYEMAWDQMGSGLRRLPVLLLDIDDHGHGQESDSVDALLSMALFMRGTADTRTTAMLVRIAVQSHWVASMTALSSSGGILDDKARNMAARKLWSLYIIDQELSITHGMPPCIHDTDIDTSMFPMGDDASHSADVRVRSRPQGLFWARVRLATIEAQVHSRLYGPQAVHLSPASISTIAHEVHAMLRVLAINICPHIGAHPVDDHSVGMASVGLEMALPLANLSVVTLHLAFCTAGSMAYRAVVRAGGLDGGDCDNAARSGAMGYCLAASRSVLSALKSWPPSTLPELWQLLPYAIAAALTILEALLNSSDIDTQPAEDANLVAKFAQYLRDMAALKGYPLTELITGCNEIARLAQVAVSRTSQGEYACTNVVTLATVRGLLSQAAHPIYIAQGLIGNMPTRDHTVSRDLAKVLLGEGLVAAMPPHRAPFAPDVLHYHMMSPRKM